MRFILQMAPLLVVACGTKQSTQLEQVKASSQSHQQTLASVELLAGKPSNSFDLTKIHSKTEVPLVIDSLVQTAFYKPLGMRHWEESSRSFQNSVHSDWGWATIWNASKTVVHTLEDRHSRFMNPKEYTEHQTTYLSQSPRGNLEANSSSEPSNSETLNFGTVANGSLGYIRIREFTATTAEKFFIALGFMGSAVEGYIIDLRNNLGGNVQSAVAVADMLIEGKDPILTLHSNEGAVPFHQSLRAITSKPIKVLVNGHSASSSEILAGALQDLGRAEILGRTTLGKGTMQATFPIETDGGTVGLKLTIASFRSPSGNKINKEGITPDVQLGPATGDLHEDQICKTDDKVCSTAMSRLLKSL